MLVKMLTHLRGGGGSQKNLKSAIMGSHWAQLFGFEHHLERNFDDSKFKTNKFFAKERRESRGDARTAVQGVSKGIHAAIVALTPHQSIPFPP